MERRNHRLDKIKMFVEKNKLMDVRDHLVIYVFDEQDFPLEKNNFEPDEIWKGSSTNRMVFQGVRENNQDNKDL